MGKYLYTGPSTHRLTKGFEYLGTPSRKHKDYIEIYADDDGEPCTYHKMGFKKDPDYGRSKLAICIILVWAVLFIIHVIILTK